MQKTNLLMRALRANAAFSATSAVAMLFAGNWLSTQLGLTSSAILYIVAAGLLLFALQLGYIVYRQKIRHWEIKTIIAGDLAWVAGSAVFVALSFRSLTATGLVIVDLVAIVVLYFAIQQIRGLRDYSRDNNILAG